MKKLESALKLILVMSGILPRVRFRICVKSCLVFQSLCGRSRLALPGFTTDATTAEDIFGGIGLKVLLLIKVKH